MKKRMLVVLGLVLSMSIIAAGSALARQGGSYGMMGSGYDRGYGDCNWNDSDRTEVAPETMAKFQKETLSMRDELITKRLELSQECDKDTPDADRIAQLRKDMIDIQTRIQKVADKYDIGSVGQGRHMRPYGGYCKGPRWGWYGAGREVKTVEEVKELVTEFLGDTALTTGEIRDQETYFEVKDEKGGVIDLLIVDKRTCRIRSAYQDEFRIAD